MPEQHLPSAKKRKSSRRVKRLRVTGVVRAMNLARRCFSEGVPPDEVETLKFFIVETVSAVERICQEHRISPPQLPAPTYRAYTYLRSLDLNAVPVITNGKTGTVRPVRVRNVVSSAKEIQKEVLRLADKSKKGERLELIAQILVMTNAIESTLAQGDVKTAHTYLPDPSRRAYQWLKYMSNSVNLERHFNALETVNHFANDREIRKTLPTRHQKLAIQIQFYHIQALYRTKISRKAIEITAHEGFTVAPPEVLRSLVHAALGGKQDASLGKVRTFAASDAFQFLALALDAPFTRREGSGAGHTYHLGKIFDRLNDEYFQGELGRPHLTWSKTITQRKLGHYQLSTDTVMINSLLDRPPVPGYVVDFVVYHELLHKQIKVSIVKGRQHAHTRTFREAERRFKQYAEAQAYLQQLGKGELL